MGETHKKELCRSRPRTASHVKARKREGGGGEKKERKRKEGRGKTKLPFKKKKKTFFFFRPSYFWCNKKRDKERQCKEGKAKRENAHTAFYFFLLISFFFLMVARHVHNSIKDWRGGGETHKNKQLGFNENEHTERKKERRSSTVKTGVESLSYSGSAGKAK